MALGLSIWNAVCYMRFSKSLYFAKYERDGLVARWILSKDTCRLFIFPSTFSLLMNCKAGTEPGFSSSSSFCMAHLRFRILSSQVLKSMKKFLKYII